MLHLLGHVRYKPAFELKMKMSLQAGKTNISALSKPAKVSHRESVPADSDAAITALGTYVKGGALDLSSCTFPGIHFGLLWLCMGVQLAVLTPLWFVRA